MNVKGNEALAEPACRAPCDATTNRCRQAYSPSALPAGHPVGVDRARKNPLAELVEARVRCAPCDATTNRCRQAHSQSAQRHLDKLGAGRLTRRVPFDRLRARINPLAELVEACACCNLKSDKIMSLQHS